MVTTEAAALVRPLWRRLRFWIVLAVVALLAAIALGLLGGGPDRPLDPSSVGKDGGRALARIIAGYGVPVTRSTTLADATGDTDTTVLVVDPDAYSSRQLLTLSTAAGRVVLVAPGRRALEAVLPDARIDETGASDQPGCGLPAASAAGSVDWPDDTVTYRAATTCYDGAVAGNSGSTVVVLGSGAVLQNQNLARRGAAALSVNLLTADRTASRVVWLLPGTDAGGDGPASVWDLFPDGTRRVFWWLVVVGAALVLWRARRLGGVVSEPLPVVVRAAELVEGHGRLYERAGARDHAAVPLREATIRRLAERLALPHGASARQVAAAVAPLVGRPPAEVADLLAGAPPTDDAGLVRLARELDDLDAALRGTLTEGRS